MKLKKKQAKPDEDTSNKGQKFTSLQPPDISEGLAVVAAVKTRQKPRKRYRCNICGAYNCGAPDRYMVPEDEYTGPR